MFPPILSFLMETSDSQKNHQILMFLQTGFLLRQSEITDGSYKKTGKELEVEFRDTVLSGRSEDPL